MAILSLRPEPEPEPGSQPSPAPICHGTGLSPEMLAALEGLGLGGAE